MGARCSSLAACVPSPVTSKMILARPVRNDKPMENIKPSSIAWPVHETSVSTLVQLSQSGQVNLNGSSKSSSFDQQDSGIDLSDQLASNGSSQRSSPSSSGVALNTPVTTVANCANKSVSEVSVAGVATATITPCAPTSIEVEALDTKRPVCTVIFENRRLKAENAVLEKFGNQILATNCKGKESQIVRSENELSSSNSGFGSDKDSLTKKEDVKTSLTDAFAFNTNPSQHAKAPGSGSRVVGASRNTSAQLEAQNSPGTDELNMKIASVKNVWESIPSMPSVLEIANEETLNESDQRKLRSPAQNVHSTQMQQMQVNNAHMLNMQNASMGFVFPGMKPIGGDEQPLKKAGLYHQLSASGHPLAHLSHPHHQQQSANQVNAAQQQQQALISSSPPSLLNHLAPTGQQIDRRSLAAAGQFSALSGGVPRIGSPSSMIYQTAAAPPPPPAAQAHQLAQTAAQLPHAHHGMGMYSQFGQQMKQPLPPQNGLPSAMMAQFAQMAQQQSAAAAHHHHFAAAAAAQHAVAMMQQQQRGQIAPGAQPMYVPQAQNAPNAQAGTPTGTPSQGQPNAVDCMSHRAHQQVMANSHLLKQHFVQQQQMHAVNAAAAAAAAGCPPQAAGQPNAQPNASAFYGAPQATQPPQKSYYGQAPLHAQLQQQHMQAIGQQLAPGQHVQSAAPGAQAHQYGGAFVPSQFGLLGGQTQQPPIAPGGAGQQYRQSKRSNLLNHNSISYS